LPTNLTFPAPLHTINLLNEYQNQNVTFNQSFIKIHVFFHKTINPILILYFLSLPFFSNVFIISLFYQVQTEENFIPSSSSLSLIYEAALSDRLFRLVGSVGHAFVTEPRNYENTSGSMSQAQTDQHISVSPCYLCNGTIMAHGKTEMLLI
jgi:hypothetical protein